MITHSSILSLESSMDNPDPYRVANGEHNCVYFIHTPHDGH